MGFRLQDLMQGAAQVAVPVLLEQHKSNIMAEREQALQKLKAEALKEERTYQEGVTAKKQAFQTSERVAGEEAEAKQDKLDLESKERIAVKKGVGAAGHTYINSASGPMDRFTGLVLPRPEKTAELREMAQAAVKLEVETNDYKFSKGKYANNKETSSEMEARFMKGYRADAKNVWEEFDKEQKERLGSKKEDKKEDKKSTTDYTRIPFRTGYKAAGIKLLGFE